MTAYVQTVAQFCKETGYGRSSVIARMDIGDIPEIPRENGKGTRSINMVEFKERVANNQFFLRDLTKIKKEKKPKKPNEKKAKKSQAEQENN